MGVRLRDAVYASRTSSNNLTLALRVPKHESGFVRATLALCGNVVPFPPADPPSGSLAMLNVYVRLLRTASIDKPQWRCVPRNASKLNGLYMYVFSSLIGGFRGPCWEGGGQNRNGELERVI